jgi:hypothetical protein
MKKVLLFCAAAVALLLSASCNKGADNKEVVLPAAKYAANAQKLLLDESATSNPGYVSIEFTESGRYIICRRAVLGGPLSVKGESPVVFSHGTYTVNNNEYILSGGGTITVAGNQITIQIGSDTIAVTYTKADQYPANDFYTTIARAWKVDKTDISVNFDGKSAVGVVKNGCDIPAILKELEEKANVDLKDEDFAGYVVSEINFTMSKTIEIAFTGKAPVAGALALSENGSLSYELTGSNGVEVLSGKANGKFDLNPGLGANQIMLTLDTELTTKSGKTYTGKVSFILSPKA